MLKPEPAQKILFVIIIILVLGIAMFCYRTYMQLNSGIVLSEDKMASQSFSDSVNQDNSTKIYVHIAGAVKNPGIYTITYGLRVIDVINKAGGFIKHADLDKINLAGICKDGQRIYIPFNIKVKDLFSENNNKLINNQSNQNQNIFPIDINRAKLIDWQQIPGIGPKLAERIINYRNANGRFQSLEELKNVSGIGNKKFEKIKVYIK